MSITSSAARIRAKKSMTDANTGSARVLAGRNLAQVLDETVSRNNLLRNGARVVQVAIGQTSIDFLNFENQFWRHVPNDGDVVASIRDPAFRAVDFDPQHMVMSMEITRKAKKRVMALTGTDPENPARAGFKTQLGNSMARSLLINDTTLADVTLNAFNGIQTLAIAGGLQLVDMAQVIGGIRVAVPYDPTRIYPNAMLSLDRPFRSGLARWYVHEDEPIHYANWLVDQDKGPDTTIRQVIEQGLVPGPQGRPFLEADYWPDTLGPNAAPTGVVDDGDGTMTVNVNSILPAAYDAGANARRVRITLDATGETEDCTVIRTAGNNTIETTGDLGQLVISVVVGDYTVQVIDETSLMFSDPNNFLFVMEDGVRSYEEVDTDKESKILKVHSDCDARIIRAEAGVYVFGYYLPNLAA